MTGSNPLDDVEFLARSDHRVRVLRTLASGPRVRVDLHEETGIPQPTLGRILGSFEERNWVERDGREYALTPFGELVCAGFEDLLGTVETVQRLGDVLEQLPSDRMDLDLRAFADATVVTPDTGDVFRHVRRAEDVFTAADHTLFLSNTVGTTTPEQRTDEIAAFVDDGDKLAESVLSWNVFREAIPPGGEARRMIRDGIESGRVRTYVYEGDIPFMLAVADDTVLLSPTDENGIPTALVESRNETILSWARDTFEEYRAAATEVTADDLPP